MIPYIIPGFSTPSTPHQDKRIILNCGERNEIPLGIKVYGAAPSTCQIDILKYYGGSSKLRLLTDPLQLTVFTRIENGVRNLFALLDPLQIKIPTGDYYLEARILGKVERGFYITVGPSVLDDLNTIMLKQEGSGISTIVVQAPTESDTTMNQNVIFTNDSAVTAGDYVGGRCKWTYTATLVSASLVCTPPKSGVVVFNLETDGYLTGRLITVDSTGNGTAELDIRGAMVPAGAYVRWLCVESPTKDLTAAQVNITVNTDLA